MSLGVAIAGAALAMAQGGLVVDALADGRPARPFDAAAEMLECHDLRDRSRTRARPPRER